MSENLSNSSNPTPRPDLPSILREIGAINHDAINTKAASLYLTKVLGIPTAPASLEVYRHRACGPRYKKIRSRVFYSIAALDDFAKGVEVRTFER